MPGTNMVVVEHVLRAAQAVRRVRPRIAAYVLMGLAVSGWMGFLVLAGVLLATMAAVAPGPGPLPESPIVKGGERDTNHKIVVKVQPAREPAPPPASGSSLYELGRYEDRRRVQERMRHADAADYEDGNVSTARNLYDYAAARGWAQAALALALTYDPNELQRRGVTVPGDPIKARACYIKARELMDAAVAFISRAYLPALPRGVRRSASRRRAAAIEPSAALQSSDVCARVSSSRESAFPRGGRPLSPRPAPPRIPSTPADGNARRASSVGP